MGNASYVFYQPRTEDTNGGASDARSPVNATNQLIGEVGASTTHVMRLDETTANSCNELWRGFSSSLSSSSRSSPSSSLGRESLEELHHQCIQHYGGTIMPVYDEGIERPCYSDDVEPIFDDADAEASNEGEQEDSPDSPSTDTTEQTRSDLEEDWLLITPSEDDKEGKTLNVLRISLDGTGRASPSRVQRAVLNSDQQDLSQSFLGRLNFFGIFSGGKGKGQHSNELNFLKDKVDLLQSQVTQVDELRNYMAQVSAVLEQMRGLGGPLPIAGRNAPGKREPTPEEIEKQLRELISCSDLSSANVPTAVETYLKCFASHKEALKSMVQRYPFLIKKLPLKPKSAFQRMQIWERYLFSTLEEKQALSWRKAKEFEIQKWETKEEILAEIDRIRLQIKEKEKKEREKELQKEQQNVMASMMEEMQSKFRTNQQEQEKLQAQTELQDLEDEPIDLDEDV